MVWFIMCSFVAHVASHCVSNILFPLMILRTFAQIWVCVRVCARACARVNACACTRAQYSQTMLTGEKCVADTPTRHENAVSGLREINANLDSDNISAVLSLATIPTSLATLSWHTHPTTHTNSLILSHIYIRTRTHENAQLTETNIFYFFYHYHQYIWPTFISKV